MRASRRLRSPRVSLRSCTSGLSRILIFTSTSEVLTPAELSMKSVLSRPLASAYSTRPRCDRPRLPPSPTTRARQSQQRPCLGGQRDGFGRAREHTAAARQLPAIVVVPAGARQGEQAGALGE